MPYRLEWQKCLTAAPKFPQMDISRWQAMWLGSGKDNVCIDAVQRTTEGSLLQGRARWQRTNGDQMCNSLELCTGWTQHWIFQVLSVPEKRRPVVKKQFPKDEFECFVTEFSPMWRKDDTHKSKLRMHDQPCPGMFTNMFSRSKPWSSTNILQLWDAIWTNMVFFGCVLFEPILLQYCYENRKPWCDSLRHHFD
jgi:hypothetical protein